MAKVDKLPCQDTLRVGDATVYFKSSDNMHEIKDSSVNLVITSPPYWTLKDYGTADQIGIGSSSYDQYISDLNKVWEECIRVLAPDGKLCINIMPFLLTGKAARFNRRETRLVLDDLSNFMFQSNHHPFVFNNIHLLSFTESSIYSTSLCTFYFYINRRMFF
jgi:DNA modification methylase